MPLLVGDLVSDDNENWENFFNLLKVMEYIFALITTQHKLEYLQTLIEDYLTEFARLNPDRPWCRKCIT